MKKKLIILLSIIILFLSIAMATFYVGKNIAPKTFKTSFVEIIDEKIPDNFYNFKILYFSDLEYGKYFNKDNLDELKKSIEKLDYDIILFGGDLIDKNYSPVSDDVDILQDFLSSLTSKYGNFAILGDFDTSTQSREVLVKMILDNSGFELIEKELTLYQEKQSIKLNGINYNSDTTINESDFFNIVMIHSRNLYSSLPQNINLVLCGDSHDRQINLFFNSDYKFGLQDNLYITRGVGLTEKDYRIFNYPELCIFILKNNN